MIEVLLLAIALAIDAFSVAVAASAKAHEKWLDYKMAITFGIFQALMPLIGYFGGLTLQNFIGDYTKYAAFALLLFLGIRMIIKKEEESEDVPESLSLYAILVLGVATSLDAMAAGLGLDYFGISPYLSVAIIGVITAIITFAGSHIGKKAGELIGSKAEKVGGVVLIAIGIKLLF